MTEPTFYLTGDPAADELLARDPNALLLGMVLDQQVSMEKAFSGPAVIAERMGGALDVSAIAAADPEEFSELCSRTPAVHRFPGAMAGRLQSVCRQLVDEYGGQADRIWAGVATGAELKKRLLALPGFGEQKASIFLALLGKQFQVTPDGWDTAAGLYGEAGAHRSVADITDPESLKLVRESKKAAKAAAKKAAGK